MPFLWVWGLGWFWVFGVWADCFGLCGVLGLGLLFEGLIWGFGVFYFGLVLAAFWGLGLFWFGWFWCWCLLRCEFKWVPSLL